MAQRNLEGQVHKAGAVYQVVVIFYLCWYITVKSFQCFVRVLTAKVHFTVSRFSINTPDSQQPRVAVTGIFISQKFYEINLEYHPDWKFSRNKKQLRVPHLDTLQQLWIFLIPLLSYRILSHISVLSIHSLHCLQNPSFSENAPKIICKRQAQCNTAFVVLHTHITELRVRVLIATLFLCAFALK